VAQALALPAGAYSADPDEAIVARARQEPEAFAEIYRRYLPRVYAYLRTRATTAEETADLTQTVFLKAMTSLHAFQPRRGVFAAWLFGIARNAAIQAHRRKRDTVSLDGLPEAPAYGGDVSPEAAVLRYERVTRVRTMLLQVEPRKRELLALRFAAGLSSREIAGVLGKSEAATKKELTRLIASLKEKYSDQLR
jgi:RNA polymerase sigma-70 factor (ECF subfamily)